MKNPTIQSNWARFAFMVIALVWATTGWLILLYGGFYTSQKYSHVTTFVDGLGTIFMAYLFLLLATVALAVVLQSFAVRRNAYVVLGLLMFVPPCGFLNPYLWLSYTPHHSSFTYLLNSWQKT